MKMARRKTTTPKPQTPNVTDSERSLAGSLLLEPERVVKIARDKNLTADCILDDTSRRVVGSVFRFVDAGIPCEPSMLQNDTGLDVAVIQKLIDDCPTAAHAEYHANLICDAALKRDALREIGAADGVEALRMALRKLTAGLPATTKATPTVCASAWLTSRPPAPDYIIDTVLETISRLLLVGSSKVRKSFLALQLGLTVSGGIPFVGLGVPRPRRVLLVNLENPPAWQHRRFLAMCEALSVTPEMIGNKLLIMNGRGHGIDLLQIETEAMQHHAEVIILDPLYKLDGGADECDMGQRKALVAELEMMTARTGAALVIVHHDPKGTPGEKNIRDRGAGSSVINRDVDATLAISQFSESHEDADNMAVLSVLARNSPPRADMTLTFSNGAFFHSPNVTPQKATSKTRSLVTTPFNGDAALALVESRTMTKMQFRDAVKSFGGTRDGREAWLQTAINDGVLVEERHGQRERMIGTPRAFKLALPAHTSDTSERPET